ncbi:MAG TPA: alpha/beta hydrolase [Gemmatales bacterium]|nr:alpha/beta hydrolase [Gemmatales bacterium]
MLTLLQSAIRWLQPDGFRPQPPLILLNGLAEQASSWYCNRLYWNRFFDVKVPEFLIYDGPVLQKRIADGLPISVDYLTDQLETFLDSFVQTPPYHIVASSLGCQVALHYAVRHPDRLGRLVLLCPSGMGTEERLPIVEGCRSSDAESMLAAIFYNRRCLAPGVIRHYATLTSSKAWKKGILRTVKGTHGNRVVDKLPRIQAPTLIICGAEDQIVETQPIVEAVRDLPMFRTVVIPRCGHAPQIEKPRLVNKLVKRFLTGAPLQREPAGQAELVASADSGRLPAPALA